MPSFSDFNDSVRCCCRTRRSCWMSSFSAFNDSGCTTVRIYVVELWGILFCQNKHFSNLQVPDIDIAMDWLIQHPTDQYTQQKFKKSIHLCLRFFLSHLRGFSAHYFVNLPPFRNSYQGSHGMHSSLPHYRACLRSNREKLHVTCSELRFLPWRLLASNWCAFMQPTSIIRITQAARRFLWSVCILMLLFQAWISTRTNTHVIPYDNLVVVYIHK